MATFLICHATLAALRTRWRECFKGAGRMRKQSSAQWAQWISIGVLLLFLAPLPMLPAPAPERYVLAELGASGIYPALAAQATVVEVYEGSLALLKATDMQIAQLRWSGVPITELRDRTTISFIDAGITFDTSIGEPSLAPALRTSDPHSFIVQFIGPIKAEWMDRIRALGGTPQMYVANAAFVVRMDGTSARMVAAEPFVNWVGAYQPAYKIQKSLAGTTGVVRIAVLGFDDVPIATLAHEVLYAGAAIFSISEVPHLVQAFVHAGRIDDIARLDAVAVVFDDPLPQTLDMKAGVVHGFHQAWYRETSGLPTTLTGVSNGPDGIRGTADDIYETVGIQDTGLDEGSASAGANDFFQGPFPTPSTNDRVLSFTDHTGCSVP